MTRIRCVPMLLCLLTWSAGSAAAGADAALPEHYGLLPFVRSVAISPNGSLYAYIHRSDDGDVFVVADAETGAVVGGARAGDAKARSIYFATDEQVIMRGSETTRRFGMRHSFEHTAAIVYNVKTNEMRVLLRSAEDLYPVQSGLGRIIGIDRDEGVAYMPAFIGDTSATYDLLKVNLENGRGVHVGRGSQQTIDWFMAGNGDVVAREDFSERAREHRVYANVSGKWEKIYELETDIPQISIQAVSRDGQSLLFTDYDQDYATLFSMSLTDGSISGPLLQATDRDIDGVLTDGPYNTFAGVLYSGLLPEYDYQDEEIASRVAAVQSTYPDSAVHPVSANADWSKIVFLVSGPDAPDDYMLFDATARTLVRIGSGYPNVDRASIAEVKAIRYKARDGLPIEAVLTWPVGVEERRGLPLLVFPHGGPASYDSVQFDWWAQYYARQGYLVLQPNFRGSTGSGLSFRRAGDGKWGKEMQDDVTDGVQAMIAAGYADRERVCIMGASYGGYAALAGGAFTPQMYRCVVAVAGVSDLPFMLHDSKLRYGRRHWVISYWERLVGNSDAEIEKLRDVSPVNFASAFQAPVLLVHGKDDTVVPLAQSKRMLKALHKAHKRARLVTLKGEDHWLSDSGTRLELLRSIDAFLRVHNPVH